jgi:hypothetical protein
MVFVAVNIDVVRGRSIRYVTDTFVYVLFSINLSFYVQYVLLFGITKVKNLLYRDRKMPASATAEETALLG